MTWSDPRTWAAGESLTAALLNVHVRDNFKALGDPWTAYTPEWTAATTNPVIGDGSLTGNYLSVGKLTIVRISMTAGSTTTFGSGSYRWSLPVTSLVGSSWVPVGIGIIQDATPSARYMRTVATATSTTILLADDTGTQMSESSPVTLAVDDAINIICLYEAA